MLKNFEIEIENFSMLAGKTTLAVMLRMKILSNKSVIAEYQKC